MPNKDKNGNEKRRLFFRANKNFDAGLKEVLAKRSDSEDDAKIIILTRKLEGEKSRKILYDLGISHSLRGLNGDYEKAKTYLNRALELEESEKDKEEGLSDMEIYGGLRMIVTLEEQRKAKGAKQ
ncbi:MAG: hypothetical protein AABW73_01915 [Nanoarchaeota archaeon]